MKIVHTNYLIVPEFNDPEIWINRLSFYSGVLEELAKEHEVSSVEKINYKGELKRKGVTYYFLLFKGRKLYFPFRLHRFIKRLQPDVVFVSGFIFPLQIIQLRLKLGKKVKIIVINRSERPFIGFKKYWQRFADRYVNAYLFPSLEFGEQWVGDGNISSFRKIHEAMHGSSFFVPGNQDVARSSLSISGSPIFLWVGRLNANKDPVTVVKGFIRSLEFQPSAKLYMIYQTEELLPEIKRLIEENNGACSSIFLVGKIPHLQMEEWYRAADFIISGSHYEGGGIAVCEAMSCGCIPVMTNIISFRKFSGPAKCGLLYEAGNVDALFSVLYKSISLNINEERKKALLQFREELSFEAIGRKIQDVIASL